MISIRTIISRLVFLLLALLIACPGTEALSQTTSHKKKRGRKPQATLVAKPESLADSLNSGSSHHLIAFNANIATLIEKGEALLGKPYRVRGIAPWALDCSGYVSYLYKQLGMHIPRSSAALSNFTERVETPQPGDLLFFKGRNTSTKRVGHVALVVANDDGDPIIMHSTCQRGIIKHRLSQMAYFSKRYLFAGRVPQIAKLLSEEMANENK